MMNDQEMQFADPEWRPRQNGSQAAAGPELYSPQPINMQRPEQARWQEPAPERVYTAQDSSSVGAGLPRPEPIYGPSPAQQQMRVGGQYGQVRMRRRRSVWPWIIAAIILFAIIGGNMGRSFGGDRSNFMDKAVPAQQVPFSQPQTFQVGTQPTIIINEQGNITIQGSGDQNVVTVQTDGPGKAIATQNGANSLQITASDPLNADVTVTAPANANLIINTDNGNVNVEGVSGQMTLTSTHGTIELHNVALTGDSTIKTGNDNITFQGSLAPNGTYQFISTGGSVDLALPSNSAFHVNATANNGSISSDFPSVQRSSQGSGSEAQGSVGNGPSATVTISTEGGDISLNAQ